VGFFYRQWNLFLEDVGVSFSPHRVIYLPAPSLMTIVNPEVAMLHKPVNSSGYHNRATCKRTGSARCHRSRNWRIAIYSEISPGSAGPVRPCGGSFVLGCALPQIREIKMSDTQSSGATAPSNEKPDTGFIPGDDAMTQFRNIYSILTGKMSSEGIEQFRVARDIRNEAADCKRCDEQRDYLLQWSESFLLEKDQGYEANNPRQRSDNPLPQ
jgi:hypothetical protein